MEAEHYSTLGFICQQLQRSPGQVEGAMRRLEIEPTLRLDGLAYFTAGDVDKIRNALRDQPRGIRP